MSLYRFLSHDPAGYHEDDIAAKEVAFDETEKQVSCSTIDEKRAGETAFFSHDPAGYHKGHIAAEEQVSG